MLPPGPRAPAALQTVEWVARPDRLLARAARRYGEPLTLRTAWSEAPLVLVWSPQHVREVYAAPVDVLRAGASSSVLEPFAGKHSVLVLDGEAHLRGRRLLLPAFHGERMRAVAPAVRALAEREVASWAPGEVVDALARMRELTLDVILRVTFGRDDPDLRAVVRRALELTSSVPRLVAMTLARVDLGPRSPYGAFTRAVRDIDAALAARIAARRAAPAAEPAIIDDLLAAGADDAEARDHLVTVLAAGHETTATALAWALERLSRRPDVVARVRADGGPYLDAVVQEVLRARPVLSITPRRVVAPFAIAGHVLPPGVDVAPCVWLAHNDPRSFPDPAAFRPERWLEGAPERGTYIPWGGGVRRCVGAAFATMELREILRVVCERVDLAPARRGDERVRRRSVTLAPGHGGAFRARPLARPAGARLP